MSCCSCCHGPDWCANICCATGLNKHKRPSHAEIQYSHIPHLTLEDLESQSYSGSSNKPRVSAAGDHNDPSASRARIKHSFVQNGSQLSLPPQMGLASGSRPIVNQPGGSVHHATTAQTRGPAGGISLQAHRKESLNDLSNSAIVQFSLHYDVTQSKLRVHLQHASNLPKTYDCKGNLVQCDPLIMLHLEPDKEDTFQSKVMKSTHDPTFNKTFEFVGLSISYIKLQTLVLRIYNHASNNKAIGKVHLPLSDAELFGTIMQMKIIHTEEMEVCMGTFRGACLAIAVKF